jgi:GntR family transcriptional regulator / MocR family aminotransferase
MSIRATAAGPMWQRLFSRFDGTVATRQGQIRDMVVHAVLEGFLAPGAAVPSSRALAHSLKLSRTTITLALQSLVDKGLLVPRSRSGYYVSPEINATFLGARKRAGQPTESPRIGWKSRLLVTPSTQRNIAKPADWQQQPYPFIYGQFDASLFPIADWRVCALESLHVRAIRSWAPDHIDRDHAALIDQIHQRLLPARGIWAERDEILVTAGAQHATFMLAQLLIGSRTIVGVENPGYPDARNNFALRTRHVRALPIDAHGLVMSDALSRCDYVYTTPSHQCPSTVTMPLARRQVLLERARADDFVVIEDDHESELNFSGKPTPALKSLDASARVIYLGSLSKTLAHGLRLGYVVAPAELIRELRSLRRLMLRHPPTNNEHSAAEFIAHGFHESYVRRLNLAYSERARTLRESLRRHAPSLRFVDARGGSALWIEAPREIDTRELSIRALDEGIVIEPGDVFFAGASAPRNFMRLGYSSIATERIDEGVRHLARLLPHPTRKR